MKFFKCAVYVLFAINLSGLAFNAYMFRELKKPDEPNLMQQSIIQQLNQIHLSGHQQRTVLLTRILGLEHIHGMHPENNVEMCPGCQNNDNSGKIVKN